MFKGTVKRQIDNLSHLYQDTNYLNKEVIDSNLERADSQLNRFNVNNLESDSHYLKGLIEKKFNIKILANDFNIIQKIYDFFIGQRIDNVSEIIYNFIISNMDNLYKMYKNQTNLKNVDRMVKLYNDDRKTALIKRVLDYIIADNLNSDLSEYISTDKLSFLNNNIDILNNISIYQILCSTVIGSDLHFVHTINEKVKQKLNRR